jgi:hypothetical protein
MRAKTNALKTRVERLYRRTHRFLSPADIDILAQYYEAKLDQCERSENFDENFRKYKEINPKDWESIDPERSEIIKIEKGVYWKDMLEMTLEFRKRHPYGHWGEKRQADPVHERVAEAKDFFKRCEDLLGGRAEAKAFFKGKEKDET